VEHPWLPALFMFLGAALYTSVGHAGASAYIAIMALFGFAPAVMRPTALVLNILVAGFTSFRYVRAGMFRWRVLWPVLIGAMPAAFIGGAIQLPAHYYRPLVGVVLFVAAARLLWPKDLQTAAVPKDPPVIPGVLSGAAIGLLSGLTGTGGGIFLSPLILFLRWTDAKSASGVAAVFILCNSIAGLAGNLAILQSLPADLPVFVGAVALGAIVGTTLGVHWRPVMILRALGLVLAIAGAKMIGVY
jgi:uncharacterized membrane protein YfcA